MVLAEIGDLRSQGRLSTFDDVHVEFSIVNFEF
jgi:hypothetical protein